MPWCQRVAGNWFGIPDRAIDALGYMFIYKSFVLRLEKMFIFVDKLPFLNSLKYRMILFKRN